MTTKQQPKNLMEILRGYRVPLHFLISALTVGVPTVLAVTKFAYSYNESQKENFATVRSDIKQLRNDVILRDTVLKMQMDRMKERISLMEKTAVNGD